MNDLKDERASFAVRDPLGSRAKREQNARKKNILKRMCDQTNGRKRNALMSASRTKTTIRLLVKESLCEAIENFLHILNNQDTLV